MAAFERTVTGFSIGGGDSEEDGVTARNEEGGRPYTAYCIESKGKVHYGCSVGWILTTPATMHPATTAHLQSMLVLSSLCSADMLAVV